MIIHSFFFLPMGPHRRRPVERLLALLLWFGLSSLHQNAMEVAAFSLPSSPAAANAAGAPHKTRIPAFSAAPPFLPSARRTLSRRRETSLYFFRRQKQPEEEAKEEKDLAQEHTEVGSSPAAVEKEDDAETPGFRASIARRFFAKDKESGSGDSDASSFGSDGGESGVAASAAATATLDSAGAAGGGDDDEDDSPLAQAQRLRAQAERVRLEAERMDAELTLEKIARLEQEMEARKKKKLKKGEDAKASGDGDDYDDDDLLKQMEALQSKLLGKGQEQKKASAPASSSRSLGNSAASSAAIATVSPSPESTGTSRSQPSGAEWAEALEETPAFVRKALASLLEMEYSDELNLTELALRMEGQGRKLPPPSFTEEQIQSRAERLRADNSTLLELLSVSPAVADDITYMNDTEIALLSLQYEYSGMQKEIDALANEMKVIEEGFTINALEDVFNRSAVDDTIEGLYPKCMRAGDDDESSLVELRLPTQAQVQQLCDTILPRVSFSATSRPESVLGGYVIRGKYTKKDGTGDDLIEAIQESLDQSPSLSGKMTVLYTNDFTVFSDPDAYETYDPSEAPPILYVVGPDPFRKPQRVLLSVTTALGLATSWYLSIYPFLLNPAINKRVEEELAVASALTTSSSASPDLSWLAELSVPLFASFVGIQLTHELAHLVVAGANRVKLSVPTFVPSIITGITSSVTTFKELPKNKQTMFDISIAGPLVGMVVSAFAIAIGSQLTLSSDPALLPALPLDILRQSTLGGGIINGVLGNGALSIPEAAIGTPAVAGITIPLHPLAVSGYISLVINSLSMLPVGTTDGGRVGLSLFGRGAKLLVGNLFLIALFTVGLLGSDLFLFYFAFCSIFQAGNEVPARNEFDKVEFSRVIVATTAYVLALLSLIPFQTFQ